MIIHFIGMDSKLKYVGGNFNILILVVDISLLLICEKHKRIGKSNMFTRNVLAVYLIHTSGFGGWILHNQIINDESQFDIGYILLVVIMVVVACILIEELRVKLSDKAEKVIANYIESKLKLF